MARRVVILGNPRAGTGKSHRLVNGLLNALQQRGLEPTICWHRKEFSTRLDQLAPEEVRCVVAAGGDGTLLEVVNRAPQFPAALLPLGNENLVAEYFRIERSGARVAEIIATGKAQQFDLAIANGRLFFLMASVGFDAEVVHRVHRHRRGHINRLTYLVPMLQTLHYYPYPLVEFDIEDSGEKLRGAMGFVFNLPLYGLRVPIAPEAQPDDGLLDLCVFERPGIWNLARYLGAVALGRRDRLPDFQHRRVRRVRLTSTQPVPVQTDGDPAGHLPMTIEVMPHALTMMVAE